MATQKQVEANRANAQKSTGPKTPEGRAAVRLNGVKHGLTSKILVLDGEQESDFTELLASLEAEHWPATPSEEILVRQLAMASWRLRRLYHVEAAVFAVRLTDLEEDMEDDYTTKLPDIERLAYVAIDDARRRSVLDNLSRYESRLERSFYKALHELQRLHAAPKTKMQNQTQSDPAATLKPNTCDEIDTCASVNPASSSPPLPQPPSPPTGLRGAEPPDSASPSTTPPPPTGPERKMSVGAQISPSPLTRPPSSPAIAYS